MADTERLDTLRAEVTYRRQRLQLYRAKAYGPRATSRARLAERQRDYERAVDRLKQAEQTLR